MVSMSQLIQLAWPSPNLSPNGRYHWTVVSKDKKSAREDACWATKAAKCKVPEEGAIRLQITFYPPDKRRYDIDGLLSRLKAGLDGIADGLNVDDHRYELTIRRGDPVKGGKVDVIILD